MTPTDPQPHQRQRFTFNPHRRGAATARNWKLRTERFDGREWKTIAHFPTLPKEHQSDQRERMSRHAEAFGGLVRLMCGELLLRAWQDGVLVVPLDEVAEMGAAAE